MKILPLFLAIAFFLPAGAKAKGPGVDTCQGFPSKLRNCEPFQCKMTHPLIQSFIVEETIVGKSGDTCQYRITMPNGGLMTCNVSEKQRVEIAKYLEQSATAERVESKTKVDLASGKSKTVTKIDGKEIEDPTQSALQNGTCKISGYGQ